MSMIPHPLTSLIRRISTISEERKLALRISGISFLVLIGILGAIIATSYFAQSERMYRDFRNEISMFEGWRIGRNIRDALGDSGRMLPFPTPPWHSDDKEFHWPRDVIIFNKNGGILKNDYLDLDATEIFSLFGIRESAFENIEIDEHAYIIYRKNVGDFTFFLTRDLTQLREFHTWLMLLAAFWSIIWLIIIYSLALVLARIMIEPIREHNKSLKAYNHNVAHELKTPLAVMQSNLEILALTHEDGLINSTREEIRSMEKTIDTLLFIANPEKQFQKQESVEIVQFTKEILEWYSEFPFEIHKSKKKIIIQTHPELYKHIITNLIENAIKYRSWGDIGVTLSETECIVSNTIANTIEETELKKLTEPFYQSDTSRNSGGQWLGLALIERITEILGWWLTINSENHTFIVIVSFGK